MGRSIKIWKDGKGASYLRIEIIDYSRSAYLYTKIGKYFAEAKYKKEMPYMSNKETNTWFLAFNYYNLVGFGAINELSNKIVLEHSYVEESYRKKGIWKEINEARFKHVKDKGKTLEVITKEEHLHKYWISKGFIFYRKNGSYSYLRKDDNIEKS
jgi:predicted GNAT family acetyltransferase